MIELRHEPVRFHFFGDGALGSRLRGLVSTEGLDRVESYGYRDPKVIADFLVERAALGIVSLAPGVIRSAYPSKTMSYLRQGTPVLALVEGDSELARTVREAGIGCQTEPGDVPGLVRLLRDLAHDRSPLDGAAERARLLYDRHFVPTHRLQQWSALFGEVTS